MNAEKFRIMVCGNEYDDETTIFPIKTAEMAE